MVIEKRMCKYCGRDGTRRSMWFYPGGVYGECTNGQACEKRRIAGDKASDRAEARVEREHQQMHDAESRRTHYAGYEEVRDARAKAPVESAHKKMHRLNGTKCVGGVPGDRFPL